jgi:hypothetical protein
MAMAGIIEQIDRQIESLQKVRALLTGATQAATKRRGRPPGVSATKGSLRTKKRPKFSAEARAKIAAAQRARWAKIRRAGK